MAKFKRRKDGRFKPKSDEDRKVRSIRATDSAWESLGDLAESQNMTRADLVEQLVQDGRLDCIQGLDALQELAEKLPENEIAIAQQLEPIPTLEPIQELVQRLEPIQELAQKLEPFQELAQKLEPIQELVQRLEPIQELAQRLEPFQGIQSLQSLSQNMGVIQDAVQRLETLKTMAIHASPRQATAPAVPHKIAIALEVLHEFIDTQNLTESSSQNHGEALFRFKDWLEAQL